MHIIANAYHFHAMVLVLVWYGIGIGMAWYGCWITERGGE
jgi:hypothetical protein